MRCSSVPSYHTAWPANPLDLPWPFTRKYVPTPAPPSATPASVQTHHFLYQDVEPRSSKLVDGLVAALAGCSIAVVWVGTASLVAWDVVDALDTIPVAVARWVDTVGTATVLSFWIVTGPDIVLETSE